MLISRLNNQKENSPHSRSVWALSCVLGRNLTQNVVYHVNTTTEFSVAIYSNFSPTRQIDGLRLLYKDCLRPCVHSHICTYQYSFYNSLNSQKYLRYKVNTTRQKRYFLRLWCWRKCYITPKVHKIIRVFG